MSCCRRVVGLLSVIRPSSFRGAGWATACRVRPWAAGCERGPTGTGGRSPDTTAAQSTPWPPVLWWCLGAHAPPHHSTGEGNLLTEAPRWKAGWDVGGDGIGRSVAVGSVSITVLCPQLTEQCLGSPYASRPTRGNTRFALWLPPTL